MLVLILSKPSRSYFEEQPEHQDGRCFPEEERRNP
jgi:hypothetical protein